MDTRIRKAEDVEMPVGSGGYLSETDLGNELSFVMAVAMAGALFEEGYITRGEHDRLLARCAEAFNPFCKELVL